MFLLDAISARPAQPQGAFSVAPDLASGLLAIFNSPNPSTDWTRIGTITQRPIAAGVAFESGAVGTRYEKSVAGHQNTGFTMFLRFVVRVTTVQDYCGIYNGATYESLIYVTGATRLFFFPKNGISFQAHSKVLAVGDVVTICATGNGSRYFVSTTINGVTERATGTYTGTSAYTSIHIGAKFTGTGSHRTMTGAFWTRALPDELVDLLAREPLRLFDDETNGAPITFEAASGNSGDYEATDSPDVFEADGDLIIEGDYAATDEPDTFAADGDLVIQGDYAATDEPDVFEAASSETIEGDYAATDSPDVFAADGDLLIEGDYAATDSPDVFSATNIAASRTQTIIRYVYRPYENVTDRRYVDQLNQDLRTIYGQISGISKGVVAAHDSRNAAPAGGSWQQGDFVRNFSPAELGSSSSKYVILGWVCVASGTPGTWLEARCLTGN